jgi:hypothetical protein
MPRLIVSANLEQWPAILIDREMSLQMLDHFKLIGVARMWRRVIILSQVVGSEQS